MSLVPGRLAASARQLCAAPTSRARQQRQPGSCRAREKAIQAWGWQLKAAKRYLDHRGMKLAAASRLKPIIVCHCKLAALGEPSSVAWDVAGEAPSPCHGPKSSLGRLRSEKKAGVPTKAAAGILSAGS